MITRLSSRLLLLALCLLSLVPTHAWAGAYTVTSPADSGSGTLRQAVADANADPGSTITFAFNSPIVLTTGELVITSPVTITGPAGGMTLGGDNSYRVFEISGGTAANPVTLTNLTITQSNAGSGALGGGVSVDSGTVVLTNCTLTNNRAGLGGGISNGGTLTLTNCTLTDNSSAGLGGGLYNYGTATLTNSVFTGNSAANKGGGLSNINGTATLANCAFTGNSTNQTNNSGSGGGGLYNESGTTTLTNCTLTNNSAPSGCGGGLYDTKTADYKAGAVNLTNCVFTGNSAANQGGALYIQSYTTNASISGSQATLTNCTLTGNSANSTAGNYGGGGLYVDTSSTATLTNDILYGDTGGEVDSLGATFSAAYCDIQNGFPNAGDIDQTPDFVTPYTNSTAPFDLHLKPGSPCAGAGTADAPNYPASDLDGRPRPTPPHADPSIGAYEAAPAGASSLVVMNADDGVPLSLRADIQCADDYPNTTITFDPTVFATPQTITLTSGAIVITGSPNITGPAGGVSISGNNTNTVFDVNNSTIAPATLIGLNIENGRGSINGYGGGLFNLGAVALTNCTLTNNHADGHGGGCYNAGTLSLTNCTLTGNSAYLGGGLYDNSNGTATLTNDILFGDSGDEIDTTGGTVNASYCDIGQSGYAGSNSNIDQDPAFATPGDLRLQPASPCIGAGATQAEAPPGVIIPASDLDGRKRPSPPSIGAYDAPLGSTATTTTLASSLNPSAPGQNVTFTVTVMDKSSNTPVTAGSIDFRLGNGHVTIPIGANGRASVTTRSLPAGSANIAAFYSDSGGPFGSSDAKTFQSVVTLTVSTLATATTGTAVTVTIKANLTSYTGPVILSSTDGNVTFSPQTVTLRNGSGTASVTFGTAGGQTVTATDAGSPADTAITATSGTVTVSQTVGTVTAISATWGSRTATLTAGSSLLPAGRGTDVPWLGVTSFTLTLSAGETLNAADVTVTGVNVASYGPVTVSGSGTSYTVTLARPISAADRVTLSVGNADITAFTGTLPVLPGDISDDGAVNATDMVLARNMIQGRIPATVYGDINGDGTVTLADYTLVSRRIGTRLP